jgi:hypothetical protein
MEERVMEHLSALLAKGNMKLPTTTAIFNMGSATDCPSLKKGLCQAFIGDKCVCYAMRPEGFRPACLPYRRRQEKYWKAVSAPRFVLEFCDTNQRKRKPFKTLRLNESGDFWNQKCVAKAEYIARLLKLDGVKTYCYTARSDLDFSGCESLVVNGSGFKAPGVKGDFLFVKNADDAPKGYGVCPGDCRGCVRCIVGMKTVIPKH